MAKLIFATRYLVKNKRKIADRIALHIDIDGETTLPNLETQVALLKKRGYRIMEADYNIGQASTKIKPYSSARPFTEYKNDELNTYIANTIAKGSVFSIVDVAQPTYKNTYTQQFLAVAKRLNYGYWLIKAARSLTNKIVGGALGRIILKAQTIDFKLDDLTPAEYTDRFIENNKDDICAEQIKVLTTKGSELDTLEISLKSAETTYPSQRLYIINVVGYDMCYQEKLEEMKDDLVKLNKEHQVDAHIIGFNFRHVADSMGKVRAKNDLVHDLSAQIQRLRDQGVPAQNILIKSYSLGAGISAKTAKRFHKHGEPVNLFHGRSFKRLSSAVAGWIRTGKKSGHENKSRTAAVFSVIAEPFIRFGLWFAKWEINAERDYIRIPDTHKEYIVVKTVKHDANTHDDKTIAHSASLHNCTSLKLLRQNHKEHKQLAKRRKMTVNKDKLPDPTRFNGHTVSMDALENNENISASLFFRQFAQHIFNRNETDEDYEIIKRIDRKF